MISNMSIFANKLIGPDSTVTEDLILEHLPNPSSLFIDVNVNDGTGSLKGEWYIRDDSSDTFYHPSGQGDLFTSHTQTTNTSGRDRYKIAAPFLGKELRVRFINSDGTHSLHVTSDLIIG